MKTDARKLDECQLTCLIVTANQLIGRLDDHVYIQVVNTCECYRDCDWPRQQQFNAELLEEFGRLKEDP